MLSEDGSGSNKSLSFSSSPSSIPFLWSSLFNAGVLGLSRPNFPKTFSTSRTACFMDMVCVLLLNHLRGHAVGPISGLHAYAKLATKVVNACDNGQWPSPPSPSCQNSVPKWLNAWTYRVGLGLNGVARISANLCENGSQQRLASLLCSGILQFFKKSASLSVQLGTKPT